MKRKKKISVYDANKLSTVIALLCTKRSPKYKTMILAFEDGTFINGKSHLEYVNTQKLAEYAEEIQGMDDELLAVARRGAQEAIMKYIYGEYL